MTAVDTAVGGLGGDNELDLVAGIFGAVEVLIHDGLPAHTVAILFLNAADDHHLVALGNQVQVLHDLHAVSSGSHAAFLVAAAAAVNNIFCLITLIRIVIPVVDVADTDGVDMGVDSNDLVAVAHPADDVAQLVELDLVVAQGLHLFGDALDNALFLAGLGRNGNHVTQELAHSGLVALGSLFDRFKIHSVPPYNNDKFRVRLISYTPIITHSSWKSNKNLENLKIFLSKALISAKNVV